MYPPVTAKTRQKQPNMRVPKYRRHRLRNFGFVEYQGQRIRLPGDWNSAKSRAAYHHWIEKNIYVPEQRLEEKEAALAKQAVDKLRGRRATISTLTLAYLEFCRAYYPTAHSSEFTNVRHAIAHLTTLHGRVEIEEFGPLKLKEVQQAMVALGKSRGYINSQVGRIRRMFRWGVSEELVPVTVLNALEAVPGLRVGRTTAPEGREREPAKWADVEPCFEHLAPPVRAMLWLQWYTGARSQSVCLAKPIQFRRDRNPWEWQPRHKTEYRKKTITIFIGPKLQQILDPFFVDRPDECFLFSPHESAEWYQQERAKQAQGKSQRCGRENGRIRECYDTGSYRQAIGRAQIKAGVPMWTPHQLRHARATMVREQFGLEAAQAVLCHESIAATQIYARRNDAMARKIAAELG